jgi:formate hydrogenlyase subunit 3/multisubunit Na+/H+ antiporter MnhD subunit
MTTFTSPLVLLLVPGLPLLLAIALMFGLMVKPLRRIMILLAPWAALPSLLLSIILPAGIVLELPWMLFGTHLGLDETARVFLFFTSILWLVAGIYAAGYFSKDSSKTQFFIYFLLSMAGNLGLILAQDMIVFYTFFALMSFACYGLVVHHRSLEALRAGRIYIILVVVGEVLLFAAFVLATLAAGSIEFAVVRSTMAGAESQNWIIALTLLGFGIKAGVIGLHVWLPLAHPVAPTPASAVLSGAMIAAGLLGWLRILPLGVVELPFWGGVMIVAGMIAVFYAVLVGLLQNNAKTVLAYSSISSMGIMTMAVGLGLVAPDSWPFILNAILIYAMHHGLAKGALFLAVGIRAKPIASRSLRYLFIAALLLPALSLAGAPLTSGMIAKHLLDMQLVAVVSPWADQIQTLMPWGVLATSLLMARFLILVWPRGSAEPGLVATPRMMWLSWLALVVVVILSPWLISLIDIKMGSQINIWSTKLMIGAFGPLFLAVVLVSAVWFVTRQRPVQHRFNIPPGDLLIIVENWLWPPLLAALFCSTVALQKRSSSLLVNINGWFAHSGLTLLLASIENRFRQWTVATMLLLMLVMVFVFMTIY